MELENRTPGENSGKKPGTAAVDQRVLAGVIRPRLMFQVAAEMVAAGTWPYRATYLEFRSDRDETGAFRIYCNANPGTIQDVVERKLDISMLNPEALVKMAYQGIGPFDRPHPLAVITVIPHYDQLGFAVAKKTGITSLDQIREQRYPLRVSTRGSLDLATGMLVNEVLKVHGFSFGDIRSWGGHVYYDQPMPNARLDRARSGELEAIFDEAVHQWVAPLDDMGWHFLPIDEDRLARLATQGFKRGTIEKALYPTLPADIPTVDFSGWPIFTHAEAPDLLITNFCAALEARKHFIQWQMGDPEQPPLPLHRMCLDSPDTPLDIPLHPAAERFWREKGYLR